jgi:hypothetical protein
MRTLRHVSVVAAVVLSVPALGFDEIGLSNWQAAPYWMPAGQVVANAAVVRLGATGAVTAIPGVSGFDLLINVNGYYAPPQGLFAHLIAVGAVAAGGSRDAALTNLGTWTSSKSGTGS